MSDESRYVERTFGTRRGQQPEENAVSVISGSCDSGRVFGIYAKTLLKCLKCPPCCLRDGPSFDIDGISFSANGMSLRYAIIPGFFARTSPKLAAASFPTTNWCSEVCKSPLRRVLTDALCDARQSIGAVDDIPGDSLLVVAFATTTQCPYLKSRCGSPTGVAHRPRDWCEIVGMSVSRELSVAYRLHNQAVAEPNRACGFYGEREQRWEFGATMVGDTLCRGTLFCGVQFFWVSEPYRCCGLGRQLVELARQNVSYGFEIPIEHVAFSEPTALGKLFAKSYTGRTDFFVF